jgi:hypothetical protein
MDKSVKVQRFYRTGEAGSIEEIQVETLEYILNISRDTICEDYSVEIVKNGAKKERISIKNQKEAGYLSEIFSSVFDGFEVQDIEEPIFSSYSAEELEEYVKTGDILKLTGLDIIDL